jgi:hypothetical protein
LRAERSNPEFFHGDSLDCFVASAKLLRNFVAGSSNDEFGQTLSTLSTVIARLDRAIQYAAASP